MKRLLFSLFITALLSCNSEKKDDESTEGKNMPGIQNVNGNMPDTSNAINLDRNKTDSSSGADSSQK